MLFAFFTIVYFLILYKLIDILFIHFTWNSITDVLALVSLFFAFIISLILANITVKRIKKEK